MDDSGLEPLTDKQEIPFPCKMKVAMAKEVTKLLDKKVIEKVTEGEDQVVSNIFGRQKKDGSIRIILNLKQFNKQFEKIHFKMESLNDAINMMTEGCYFASIDLKDAYFSVNINQESRKFFRFRFDDILYQFIGLPQGYKDSPRIFTKIMVPVLKRLRAKGHKLVGYIDDFCVKADTKENCKVSLVETSQLFDSLGFTVHPEKSQFNPSNRIIFLGFVLDSIKMEVSISDEKATETIERIDKFLKEEEVTIRQFAQIIGTLVALDPGNSVGSVFWRRLELEKAQWLKEFSGDFDSLVIISETAKEDLLWWIGNIQKFPVKVGDKYNSETIITTDASLEGWGAVKDNIRTGGSWSEEERDFHINELELKTILLALKALCDKCKCMNIKIFTDNSTALACINKKGSNKARLNELTRLIWLWAIDHDVFLTAWFIPGVDNVIADTESRKIRQIEWKLNTDVFKKLEELRGPFLVDLFASRISHQISKYVSWLPDPEAWKVNAFSFDWNLEGIYCFPPFCLISRILHRLTLQQSTMTIIVPRWEQRPWYPQVMELLVDIPILLPLRKDIVQNPVNGKVMTCVNLNLMACTISGRNSDRMAFLKKLETLSQRDGGNQPKRPITILSNDLFCTATLKAEMWWIRL